MGDAYNPEWKAMSDDFSSPNFFKESFLHYAAIDACATYKLYFIIVNSLKQKEANDEESA